MKVVWTNEARNRLFEIEDYIAHEAPANAVKFVQKLIDRAKILETSPDSGRKIPEYDFEDYRELTEGNYRIIYRVKKDVVEIETVFEGRRILKSHHDVKSPPTRPLMSPGNIDTSF